MTNQEKFIEVMNNIFDAGLTTENMRKCCSPCGALKKIEYACKDFSCNGCIRWWDKEYHRIEQSSHPLTLDELREMDGEPVWVVHRYSDWITAAEWAIVSCPLERAAGNTLWLKFENYGEWIAYRRRPEEEIK